ncbi:hypothetical protein INN71_04015 [Nocardioides sp. ChNu-153]|uniref:YlbL family protein n=1 Tax=unclassified Nocardioides TaxID=2615069 RepID=UPI002405C88A|nr:MULTISPECIES: S16 family serine protease [unclassified Nocardioides]MDF9716621.1 hypothetical protein [Nocardioides sp. ChNu-99]MDN7120554.1 hypothetical protein [Nocardioides sp. ChNu-153]
MKQRTLAGVVAVPLVVGLWSAALFLPAPFVTYYPGTTADLLGESDGTPIVEVEEHESFPPESGELRMTTASITRPETQLALVQALSAWRDPDAAVRPYDSVYDEDEDNATSEMISTAQMTGSVDVSIAVALAALDIDFTANVQVGGVRVGYPAEGLLQPGDVVRSIGGRAVTAPAEIGEVVQRAGVGARLAATVERDGEEREVEIVPVEEDDRAVIGITPVQGYDFPFPVRLTPPAGIGGSSAGTMFALAVYDYLTPGDLTGGLHVAGTGTISPEGEVGPIGGIAQKIPGARDDGAAVFLVPVDNCGEALGAANGDVRLVAIDTFDRAVETLTALADDVDADVLTCEDVTR